MRMLLLSFIVLIFGYVGLLNPIRDGVQYIFSPLQIGLRQSAISIKSSFIFFVNLKNLRDENLQLLEENDSLRSIILELKASKEENKLLKNQLEVKNTESFERDLIIANVLGNSADLTGGSIILDKGTKHAIAAGNNVIRGHNLVGIVRSVSARRSIVDLIISPSVSITAQDIDSVNKTEGIASGQYGTSIQMKRILPGEEIKVGDTIITSGKDGLFEPGLVVGKVVEVVEESAEPLKSAYLDTLVDISALDKVFVILN